MIDVNELFKDCIAKHKECERATTDDYLNAFSQLPNDETTKDFRLGLDQGFNYALAMMHEEFGDEYSSKWIEGRKKSLVRYYSDLIHLRKPIINKVIRDGKVAVLISPKFGAGWYSWDGNEEMLFHPKIVELVEQNRHNEITDQLCKELFNTSSYGASELVIQWLPVGTKFYIEEYDGAETIITTDGLTLVA